MNVISNPIWAVLSLALATTMNQTAAVSQTQGQGSFVVDGANLKWQLCRAAPSAASRSVQGVQLSAMPQTETETDFDLAFIEELNVVQASFNSDRCISAVVPGTVLTSLLANGTYNFTDPYFETNLASIPDINTTGPDAYTFFYSTRFRGRDSSVRTQTHAHTQVAHAHAWGWFWKIFFVSCLTCLLCWRITLTPGPVRTSVHQLPSRGIPGWTGSVGIEWFPRRSRPNIDPRNVSAIQIPARPLVFHTVSYACHLSAPTP